jgi:hypothetical protein
MHLVVSYKYFFMILYFSGAGGPSPMVNGDPENQIDTVFNRVRRGRVSLALVREIFFEVSEVEQWETDSSWP